MKTLNGLSHDVPAKTDSTDEATEPVTRIEPIDWDLLDPTAPWNEPRADDPPPPGESDFRREAEFEISEDTPGRDRVINGYVAAKLANRGIR